jgi:hypothetical protein
MATNVGTQQPAKKLGRKIEKNCRSTHINFTRIGHAPIRQAIDG